MTVRELGIAGKTGLYQPETCTSLFRPSRGALGAVYFRVVLAVPRFGRNPTGYACFCPSPVGFIDHSWLVLYVNIHRLK